MVNSKKSRTLPSAPSKKSRRKLPSAPSKKSRGAPSKKSRGAPSKKSHGAPSKKSRGAPSKKSRGSNKNIVEKVRAHEPALAAYIGRFLRNNSPKNRRRIRVVNDELTYIDFKPKNNKEFREAIEEYINDPVKEMHKYGMVGNWDVSKVTDMSSLFENKDLRKGNFDLEEWDVSNVTNMSRMFLGANFNGFISKWDVSKVTDMTQMFEGSNFNNRLSKWDVSKVTDMSQMFYDTQVNDRGKRMARFVSEWDPKKLEEMYQMFSDSDVTAILAEKWGIEYDAPQPMWDVLDNIGDMTPM